jgi:hypothetical protein
MSNNTAKFVTIIDEAPLDDEALEQLSVLAKAVGFRPFKVISFETNDGHAIHQLIATYMQEHSND